MNWTLILLVAIGAIFAYLFMATWISRRRKGDERDVEMDDRGVPEQDE